MDEAHAIIARARELISQTELLINNPEEYFKDAGLDPRLLQMMRQLEVSPEMQAEAERRFEQMKREVDREVAERLKRDRREAKPAAKTRGRRDRKIV